MISPALVVLIELGHQPKVPSSKHSLQLGIVEGATEKGGLRGKERRYLNLRSDRVQSK